MNEVLLAFITFALGVIATILTQFLNRNWGRSEKKRQRKLERLGAIQEWMSTYRQLFECQYPRLRELVLAHRYIDPNYYGIVPFESNNLILQKNKEAFAHIRDAMRDFKATEVKHKEVEKEAIFALLALGANGEPNFIKSLIYYVPFVLLRRKFVYLEIADGGFELWYPEGFLREIAPYLSELHRLKYDLFIGFPRRIFYDVNWKLLDTVEFEQFSELLLPRYDNPKTSPQVYTTKEEIELINDLDHMDSCRLAAKRAIEKALLLIDKYQTKWL